MCRGFLYVKKRPADCWVARLLRTRDGAWLEQRRAMHVTPCSSWTTLSGRTETRAAAAPVPTTGLFLSVEDEFSVEDGTPHPLQM